ncbi:MAG: hypothetical protein F4X17_04595 [Gemmatimonadetes bacterium]|nr:hypothetical protein [Gemmatimonadota bacterium]
MGEIRSRPQATILLLSTVLGILLGTSILLATKINNPPIVPMAMGLEDLLGKSVPEYELEQLDGAPISTHLYKEKSHLLVFTLPGCDACDTMYPILGKTATDIPILMVANTREGLMEKVSEHALTFPIAVDTLLLTMEHLSITNFPTVLLVDREQRIVEAVRGGGFPIEKIVQSAQRVIEKEKTE